MRPFYSLLVASLMAGSLIALSGCANTIRGVGQDASNTIDATQNAARRTVRAVGG